MTNTSHMEKGQFEGMLEKALKYPFDLQTLLTKKKVIRDFYLQQENLLEKRIAILGGSTTSEIRNILELFLLSNGIRPVFYESDYNKYYEDVIFSNAPLKEFAPEIVYIHTTSRNISMFPTEKDDDEAVESLLNEEFNKFKSIWEKALENFNGAFVIQNNFEPPVHLPWGNAEFSLPQGKVNFILRLNEKFAGFAQERKNFYINDIHAVASQVGLHNWHDSSFWYAYKSAVGFAAIPYLAHSVASIVKSILGKNKKCLVLDLDNTLWGGVVGDVGIEGLTIGHETALAEAYRDFQIYLKHLKDSGVVLAVCSKNDLETARSAFAHPDNVLQLDDFAAFKANWENKDINIIEIANELNIGLDSIVFVDDNPAERELVKLRLPEVEVPNIGEDIGQYSRVIDSMRYFERTISSMEDRQRSQYYSDNLKRTKCQTQFTDYAEFLRSLEMQAEIRPFAPIYLDRITQLTNKTNQFNMTTKRYTYAEIAGVAESAQHISLYGKLMDKYGDNGLVSVIIGLIRGTELHIDLWLMSCRVFNRDMECAMLDRLLEECRSRKITSIGGSYIKTAKNDVVKDLYKKFGFTRTSGNDNGDSSWALNVNEKDELYNKYIKIQ